MSKNKFNNKLFYSKTNVIQKSVYRNSIKQILDNESYDFIAYL